MAFRSETMFASRNKCIASSNKCLTSSNKTLLETCYYCPITCRMRAPTYACRWLDAPGSGKRHHVDAFRWWPKAIGRRGDEGGRLKPSRFVAQVTRKGCKSEVEGVPFPLPQRLDGPPSKPPSLRQAAWAQVKTQGRMSGPTSSPETVVDAWLWPIKAKWTAQGYECLSPNSAAPFRCLSLSQMS